MTKQDLIQIIQEELETVLSERCQKGYKTHPKRKTKKMYGKTYRNCIKADESSDEVDTDEILGEEGSKSLNNWFKKDKDGAGPGKGGGWVDCNTCRKTKGGRKKCKPCGRQKGEKRKYPRCRPTPGECSKRGNWGKKSKKANKDKK